MKKTLSLMMALMILCSIMVMPAHALDATATAGVKGENTVPVVLAVEAATFSVTVPSSLPVAVAADGAITVADNAAIVNNSVAPVKVTNATVTANTGWTLIPFDTDPTSFLVDEKKIGLELNGIATGANGAWAFSQDKFPVIAAGASLPITYDAIVPPQTQQAADVTMANVVFTIGWAQ